MARIGKKGLVGIIALIVVAVIAGGYFVRRHSGGGVAASADSTGDSTAVAAADTSGKKGDEEEDGKKEPDPVPVEVSVVSPRRISSYYHTTATLDPERKVDILAKIRGEVTRIYVEEGAVVEAGALLCEIEDGELKISLDEARINKEKQKREFDRIRSMYDEKIVSDREYTEAKYQYELAENSYAAAAIKYEYTKIRAPFGGVVTKRHVELGENLTVGSQVFEVVDPNPLLIRMYLPENEIKDIRVGQEVTIHPDNAPESRLVGKILRIAPEVDERTGTVKVTAETYGNAMPGSFARIKIVTDTHLGSLTIPRRGLVSDAGELYVYVAESDSVRKCPVQIGYQDEDYAEVLAGVERGDSVVVVGVGGLRTGTKIKVLEPTMQEALSRQDEQSEKDPASN